MLKSPTSILNSIQRMKTNLRMDKQQLKKIKNNFIYLDSKDCKQVQQIKQFDYQSKLKQRQKSTSILKNKKQSKQNQQNLVTNSLNYNKIQQESYKYDTNINDKHSESIKKDINNIKFSKKNQQQSALIITQKQSQAVRNIKLRYQNQIEKLKECFEIEKQIIIKDQKIKIQGQKMQYEQKINQMLEYANFLQDQIKNKQQNKQQITYNDIGCQIQQKIQYKINIQCQTDEQYKIDQQSIVSKIQSQNSPNNTKFNKKDTNLLELCSMQNQQQINSFRLCCHKARQKYQSIINCLLEENRKLHLKVQKIYSSNSYKQNSSKDKSNSRNNNNWISYGSVSSRLVQQSRQITQNHGKTKNFSNYFTAKQTNLKKLSQQIHEDSNKFQVADLSNYNSNKESNKSKSIIYKVSNVMSSSFLKQRKDSKTKLGIKNPPYKIKQTNNNQVQLKTQSSCRSYDFDNKQNIDTSNFKSCLNTDSHQRVQQILNANKCNKNVNDFKFYNQDFMVSNKQTDILQDDECQIMNDQMKLKTIKQFKCFTKN